MDILDNNDDDMKKLFRMEIFNSLEIVLVSRRPDWVDPRRRRHNSTLRRRMNFDAEGTLAAICDNQRSFEVNIASYYRPITNLIKPFRA